jgi:hypothetical protein
MHGREFYERLRSTWERFIEERLFARVVQRLERNVIVGALPKVVHNANSRKMFTKDGGDAPRRSRRTTTHLLPVSKATHWKK